MYPPIPQLLQLFLKTPSQGAATSVYAASNRSITDHSGAYLIDCRIAEPSTLALDEKLAQDLWNMSMKIVGLRDKE